MMFRTAISVVLACGLGMATAVAAEETGWNRANILAPVAAPATRADATACPQQTDENGDSSAGARQAVRVGAASMPGACSESLTEPSVRKGETVAGLGHLSESAGRGEPPYEDEVVGPDACEAEFDDPAVSGQQPCYPRPCLGSCGVVHERLWVQGNYLLGWSKASHLPPLVTTSPTGTTPANSGVLGEPGTSILVGNGPGHSGATSGARFTLGYWLGPCSYTGIEGSYLFLGPTKTRYQADNSAAPILARPYTDTGSGTQSSLLVAHPDYLAGAIAVEAKSDFQAGELLFRRVLLENGDQQASLVLGYRFAWLQDDLVVDQYSRWTVRQGMILAGTTKVLSDAFSVANQFHGAEIGLAYCEQVGRLRFDSWAKVGLGNSHSSVDIDGQTTTAVPNGPSSTYLGGLLAQETNIGHYTHDRFAALPEVGITLGYALTYRLHATLGYTFLYWPAVTRAAEQVDLGASQLPPEPSTGAQRPAFSLQTAGFWVQGMNFGLEYQF